MVSTKERWEEKICFTPDDKEAFFGRHFNAGYDHYFRPVVIHAKFSDGNWTVSDTAVFATNRFIGWPILNQQGTMLFMEEVTGKSESGVNGQIVFSKKLNGQWSALDTLIPDVEAIEGCGLAQITNDSTLYFYSRYERIAYYSKIKSGKYTKPVPLSFMINPAVEFFVSPDNDYIIFKPIHWGNHFHISYNTGENEWSMPIPLSTYFKKNKGWIGGGGGPYVSPDGKYFFFLRDGDIYWVTTDFIEALRHY